MRSVNMLVLIGNVGNDPEVRETQGGTLVCTLSVATSYQWGASDARQEKTEWHRVVLWAGLAEVADKWVRKGDRVYIQGRIEYRTWQDKEGQTRYTTEVVAQELVMLGQSGGRRLQGTDSDPDDGGPGQSAEEYFDRKAERRSDGAGERTAGTGSPRSATAKAAGERGKRPGRKR